RSIDADAMAALIDYRWPGNVRELENVIERLVVTCRRETVTVTDLPHEVRTQSDALRRPARERRRTIADDLYKRLVEDRESFLTPLNTTAMAVTEPPHSVRSRTMAVLPATA